MNSQPGKLLRFCVSKHDQYQGKPLYQAIVTRCQELHLAGVTVFRGLEGFGESSEVHRKRFWNRDQPIVITVIESPGKSARGPTIFAGHDAGRCDRGFRR